MAQILLLKISSDGVPLEMNSAADEITLLTGKFGNLKLAGNVLTSEDTDGNVTVTPNGSGAVILKGLTYPVADGLSGQGIVTNGAGILSFDYIDADSVCNIYTAAATLTANDMVYISAADNVDKVDASSGGITSRAIGFAKAGAAPAASVSVCSNGVQSGFTGLTAGSRYYADPSTPGLITATVPTGTGNTIIQAGYAKSATQLHIDIEQLGRRA